MIDSANAAILSAMRITPSKLAALALFGLTYVLAGGFGQGLALIPGMSITFWPPAGIFMAALLLSNPSEWPAWIAIACASELTCNALWFHNGALPALLYFTANALEAVTAALLARRFVSRPVEVETAEDAGWLVLLCAGLAPIVGATMIATIDAVLGKHSFASAFGLVWLGDGTGLLVSAPLTIFAVRAWQERARISRRQFVEASALLAALLLVSTAALRGSLPSIYVVLPLLLWAAARFQLKGAAAGLAVVTLMMAGFGARHAGDATIGTGLMHERVVGLQIFLAVSAACSLFVGALSMQRRQAMEKLRASYRELEDRVVERTVEVKRAEERFRAMAETMPALVWTADRQGNATYRNPRWVEYTGIDPAKHTSEVQEVILHPDDRERCIDAWTDALAAGSEYEVEARMRGRDGAYRWFLSRAMPIRDESGSVLAWYGSSVDIQELKQIQEKLRESDRKKDEFLATLSHELRSPLAPIINSVALLDRIGSDNPLVVDARETIHRQVTHLVRLVDDLLELSRITQGKVRLRRECIDLRDCVRQALELVDATSRENLLRMHVDLSTSRFGSTPITLA